MRIPHIAKSVMTYNKNLNCYIRLTAFFQDNLTLTGARDDGVAVAAAGPYANNLRLALDRVVVVSGNGFPRE